MEGIDLFFVLSVFGAGLLSFFSPCVLPVLPVYVGYLSAGKQTANTANIATDAAQNPQCESCETGLENLPGNSAGFTSGPLYKKLLNTLAFVSGLSVTFFLLGFGAGALGNVINNSYFFIACGLIVFIFGLLHSGLISIPFLQKTKRIEMPKSVNKGTLLGAFLLGLLFSFAWTPCVGPILGSVLAISSQQGGALTGGGLLLVYSLGLSIPFFIITLGSGLLLGSVKKINKHLPKIKLAGGLLIAAMGLYLVFSQVSALTPSYNSTTQTEGQGDAVDFTLLDFDGNTVSLSDYRGTPVYIKFWGTWCPSCLAGLEDFSAVAREYNETGDLRVLSVVAPGSSGEMDEQSFKDWANGQQLDFPILFDSTDGVNRQFNIRAYPTSVFIDENGEVSQTRIGDMGADELRGILDSMIAS